MPEFAHTTRRVVPTTGPTTLRAPAAQQGAHAGGRIASVLQLRHILARSPRVAQLARTAAILQRETMPEDELVQTKRASVAQRTGVEDEEPIQRVEDRAPNRTGMPDELKAGLETLSGLDLSDVRVHANSTRPAALDALAYASDNQIFLGPGQERHLPHEAWHVVQQRQGRVPPTTEVAGVPVNDDVRLEAEADVMGARAMQFVAQRRATKART